jgi:hypothetical protein
MAGNVSPTRHARYSKQLEKNTVTQHVLIMAHVGTMRHAMWQRYHVLKNHVHWVLFVPVECVLPVLSASHIMIARYIQIPESIIAQVLASIMVLVNETRYVIYKMVQQFVWLHVCSCNNSVH